MFFWASAARQLAAKFEAMRNSELRLMEFSRQFGEREESSYEMELFDTTIPSHVVPFHHQQQQESDQDENGNSNSNGNSSLVIHGIEIQNKAVVSSSETTTTTTTTTPPLVLLHGYANGSLYFYRNLVGLSHYFPRIFSLDMLGWGLSSRPHFLLKDESTETAEAFFVESLEAWRKAHKIDKMILAGHSMGGHMSVAYCEQYPQHVDRLILLSPAGVPEENQAFRQRRDRFQQSGSLLRKSVIAVAPALFDSGTTPCSILRAIPESTGLSWVHNYVQRRLPAISNPQEQTAVADYLYHNATLPGSGEYALNRILTPWALGQKPTIHRIPKLKISNVTFLYGDNDWMDSTAGLAVEELCRKNNALLPSRSRSRSSPKIDVYEVPNAGHLLMLDNWQAFNAGIVIGGLGTHKLPYNSNSSVVPRKLVPERDTDAVIAEVASTNSNPRPTSQTVSVQA